MIRQALIGIAIVAAYFATPYFQEVFHHMKDNWHHHHQH